MEKQVISNGQIHKKMKKMLIRISNAVIIGRSPEGPDFPARSDPYAAFDHAGCLVDFSNIPSDTPYPDTRKLADDPHNRS